MGSAAERLQLFPHGLRAACCRKLPRIASSTDKNGLRAIPSVTMTCEPEMVK